MFYQPQSEEEARYLAAYDPKKYYPNPAVACDCLLFAYDKCEQVLKALLVRRGGYPYRGWWAIPGGFMEIDERPEEAVRREMREETSIDVPAELHCLMADPGRDPRQRVLTPEYAALMDFARTSAHAGDDAAEAVWFTVESLACEETRENGALIENFVLSLAGQGSTLRPVVRRRTELAGYLRETWRIADAGGLGFDHAEAVVRAMLYLRRRLQTAPIAYNVFPEPFTPEALAGLYRAAGLAEEDALRLPWLRPCGEGKLAFVL